MMTTNHLGSKKSPKVHPEVASIAREMLNKSENELSGVVSTAMSFLEIYRDPIIAKTTSACDWCIADLKHAERPVSLYLVVPPSDKRLKKMYAELSMQNDVLKEALGKKW